jgi:hypothetical protein
LPPCSNYAILTATYWEIGRQIVEFEQGGKSRAEYGDELLARLAADLTAKHGRGFSRSNLQQMRLLFLGWEICQTPSGKLQAKVNVPSASSESPIETRRALIAVSGTQKKRQTVSGISAFEVLQTLFAKSQAFVSAKTMHDPATSFVEILPLPWSHYVRLMSVQDNFARRFYEDEAIRGGWSVRQLDRQISTQFYERTTLSKNKASMLRKGQEPRLDDVVPLVETIRDPDAYSGDRFGTHLCGDHGSTACRFD